MPAAARWESVSNRWLAPRLGAAKRRLWQTALRSAGWHAAGCTSSLLLRAFSLRTSAIAGIICRLIASVRTCRGVFDDANGAVGIDKHLIGDAPEVGFCDLVDAIHAGEQFAPVAVAGLVGRQLRGQALVVGEAPDQSCFGARFDHLQLVVGNIFLLQFVDLSVD